MKFVIAAIVWSSSAMSYAAPFSHKLGFWSKDAETCEASKDEVRGRFANATGRNVIQMSCDGSIPGSYSMVITYDGEAELWHVSTFDWHAMSQGIYRTKDECEAALAGEETTFEEHTGLVVAVSYCYAETSSFSDSDHPFVARVDGFGVPVHWPITNERTIYTPPLRALADIEREMRDGIEAEGVLAPKVVVDRLRGSHRTVLRYYAKRRLPIEIERVMTFFDNATCEAQRQPVANLMAGVDVMPMSTFCARDRLWSQYTELYAASYTKGPHAIESTPGRYSAATACEADRLSVENSYRGMGRDVAGSVCGYVKGSILEPDGYYVRLFMRL